MRRPLKVFAFDPSHGRQLGNHLVVHVPHEPDLKPGPTGQRIAVVDYDATNECYYAPVDLNRTDILLSQGLDPSESNPQFHQQMVYAVAWETISIFEQALGRPIRWTFPKRGLTGEEEPQNVAESDRLRIFPHAMQEANAYYSRDLGALLFGYFADHTDLGRGKTPRHVFSCLSHDIIAHETTHAILDVLRNQYLYASNVDVAAFHEAFADIVALFQHFSVKEALLDTIQRTGGELHRADTAPDAKTGSTGPVIIGEIPGANPLLNLARQFGQSMGLRSGLRSALGTAPRPEALATTTKAHARGAILVAAVFDAFFTIYLRRTRDLMRIARAGGGVTQAGDLHPDLANRLASEASKTAAHFLRICIRSIDYCPISDINFGDFLSAMITADHDVAPEDPLHYREALIQAFAARGIRPEGAASTSEEAVRWQPIADRRAIRAIDPIMLATFDIQIEALRADLRKNRSRIDEMRKERARAILKYVNSHRRLLGLAPDLNVRVGVVARSLRVHQDGIPRPEYCILLHQRSSIASPLAPSHTAMVSGGSTLILASDGTIRFIVSKPVLDKARKERQKAHITEQLEHDPRFRYASVEEAVELSKAKARLNFAALHRGY